MDKSVLHKLQRITGSLKTSEASSASELKGFHRSLAEAMIRNPELDVSGNLTHHELAEKESTVDLSDRFSHLSDLFEKKLRASNEPSPMIFRRDTAFRNNLLGSSVPLWGSGMAASKSYGPFIDDFGLPVWFDFFFAIKTVKVFLQGESTPSLLIPIRGILSAQSTYRIEAGSAWIASHLIARTPQLKGYYTGVKINGGSFSLQAIPTITDGNIILHSLNTGTIELTLQQNANPAASADCGFDAQAVAVALPDKFQLSFNAGSSTVTANDASATLFAQQVSLQFAAQPPVYIDFLSHLLIPYRPSTVGNAPDSFLIASSNSTLCSFNGSAGLDSNSGWLLPVAKVDPGQLGEAAGTGSICVGLKSGIQTTWKGLKGGKTKLQRPAIIAEPGMLTVIDFFADNTSAKQKWELWQNAGAKHHSEITLGFGKVFPFIFISNAKGTEALTFFCNHKASFDRPLEANGAPFPIKSTIAIANIIQTAKTFRATLFDNDLLFDGNPDNVALQKKHSIALRNAFFSVTAPYSLVVTGDLEGDNKISSGSMAMMFGIYSYLPTLPDPYVASYTQSVRGQRLAGANIQMALGAFMKWPNKGEDPNPDDNVNDWAYLYFRFAPLNFPAIPQRQQEDNPRLNPKLKVGRNFQTGVTTFNRSLLAVSAVDRSSFAVTSLKHEPQTLSLKQTSVANISETISRVRHFQSNDEPIARLNADPLLSGIKDKNQHVQQLMNVVERGERQNANALMASNATNAAGIGDRFNRLPLFSPDNFMLLDVSSNADQMGVSFGAALRVEHDQEGNANIRSVNNAASVAVSEGATPLQILNMDVVATAQNLRAVTLPQISWEPISNIPLPVEGAPDPADTITVTPGLLIYDNDGIPTKIFSESPYPVPITPLSVTNHFLKEYNDKKEPRQLHSVFTLPFALIAQASYKRNINLPENKNARLKLNMPWFAEKRGGLQIKTTAPDVAAAVADTKTPSFPGWTLQLDHNLKWFIYGIPITGSTLGNMVKTIFNNQFSSNKPQVPVEEMEISGYGASMFSDWRDKTAAIAEVSQAKFDVVVGRTGHEVIQVRSIMYPYAVHVVRTITLMRSPNGYVFRSDSGWKAESDGFFDFDYKINFGNLPARPVDNPYEVHNEVVRGVSNVREIRDFADGGKFTSSFGLKDPGLPLTVQNLTLAEWDDLFKGIALTDKLDVELQAVVFDADVHMRHITSGGVKAELPEEYKVQSRKMLGYVQLAPASILIPDHVFASLLEFQNGSLGGSVDSMMDIVGSGQRMRMTRADVSPARNSAGKPVFVSASRGSLILPQDGSWSVVKQHTDTGDVRPIEQGQTVPLIKANGAGNYRIANPADILVATASKINFGVLQSTGTQKLLFDIPQFQPAVKKLLSQQTFFADAYKLLNSKGVFPNIANALQLTNAEKEIAVLGEGLLQMAERDINVAALLPASYEYVFIEEPDILKVYAEYSGTNGSAGNLKLGINSAGALEEKWKAALSSIRIVVDLGPFKELMWVDGNFNAGSAVKSALDKPNLQFGPVLEPVVDILRILATLTGDDFDKGMNVGMSNSPDNWEYKMDCSKEIPVIKFPSPLQLSLNPNPPLKLEAGLKVGFYFNQMLSIPTDLKQLVPACGAYVEFYGRLQVQCFTLGVASIYAVGQVVLGIAADTKAGKILYMKVGFGVEIVVGLPVVANVAVLYMAEVEVKLGETSLHVGALLLFRGMAEICGGLVAICIQIEAGGAIERDWGGSDRTNCIAQVTFSIDVCVLWVIDINYSDSWEETRQIS
ncbi:MAG: hypothetical protein H7Y31_16945 [Chitinophagaceae bacterium]|nr:hypothetical protein [Chitinophagaceae bacterium]